MKALNNLGIDKLLENALKKKDFAEGFTIGRAIGFGSRCKCCCG